MRSSSRQLLLSVLFSVLVSSCYCYWDQPCAPGICIPNSVHLALTGNSTEMGVGWFTLYKSLTSTVVYGTSPNSLTNTATGIQSSYLESNYQDITFWQHFVTATGLSPSTTYYYKCGDPIDGWSPIYTFTTAPEVGSTGEFKFAVYGDMGIANSQFTQSRLYSKSSSGELNFIFHIGDIGYADDYTDAMYEAVWDQWFATMQPVTSIIPYMVTPGNHEYSCYQPAGCSYATNFTVYNNRFKMPYKESGGVNNMWYSFDYGNVHFVSIDTETDYPNAPEGPSVFGDQLTWLQNDLAAAAQNPSIDWIVAGGHRPIYSSNCAFSSGQNPTGSAADLQQAIEGLFHQYAVDIYLCGHVHSYERDYPTYQNVPLNSNTTNPYDNPQATVYVVSGAAGCTEGFSSCWNDPAPSWSAYRLTGDAGYGIITINDNSLTWDFHTSSDDKIVDTFTITKN